MLAQLQDVQRRRPLIQDIRGRGLMVGIELRDSANAPVPTLTDAVLERMKDAGFLLGKTGPARNVLTLMPPLITDQPDLDSMVAALDDVLRHVNS